MFVNETEDFHLQKYSPLIDAGDTLVNDVDGTRSDIGLYGGPYGKSYDYLDLAPVEPEELRLWLSLTLFVLPGRGTTRVILRDT